MSETDVLGDVCKHGSLARSCEICERDAEIERLREQLKIAICALKEIRNDVKFRGSRTIAVEAITALEYESVAALEKCDCDGELHEKEAGCPK